MTQHQVCWYFFYRASRISATLAWYFEVYTFIIQLLINHLTHRVKCFLNPVDLFHVSVWERATWKHLEMGGHMKKLENDWMNLLSIAYKADQSHFILPALLGSSSSGLPIAEGWLLKCVVTPWRATAHSSVWQIFQSQSGVKGKHLFHQKYHYCCFFLCFQCKNAIQFW